MFRLVAASRVVREAVPSELVVVFYVVTLLGSAKFLIGALSVAYWNWSERRRELLALVGVAFVALTVTLALKHGLGLPRPPESVRRYPVETSSVGFPSGHAIAATVAYGGGLVALGRHDDPRALLAVGTVVLAVGLSRVVLGVHYLGDVLAGLAVGLAVLALLAPAVEYGPVYGFGAAAVLSVPALVVTGASPDAVLALGGSLGGIAAVTWLPGAPDLRSRVERGVLNVAGIGFVATTIAAREAVETVEPAVAVASFLLTFGVVGLPWAVGRALPAGSASTAG